MNETHVCPGPAAACVFFYRLPPDGAVFSSHENGGMKMSGWEICLMAVGLSMDAFAVSLCKGLTAPEARLRQYAAAGLYFGGFQALMPLLGYALGRQFAALITQLDHWIAFVLLAGIGLNMVLGSRKQEGSCKAGFGPRVMLPMAVATSIDALAVGVTFAFLQVNVWAAAALIGAITFAFSFAGVRLGQKAGLSLRSKAECLGGLVLILLGAKILIEHLGLFG